jgi:hypothetical protein
MSSYHATITGDVVQSERLSAPRFKSVQEIIKRGGVELQRWFPDRIPLPLEMFRGDSWQLLVTDPGDALRIALYLRAYVRAEAGAGGVDTRLSIGVGTVDLLPEQSVREGRGEAFRVSGELLDKKSGRRMRFALSKSLPGAEWRERSIDVLLSVLDVVAIRWTSAQARALCGALLNWKQERIAQNWPGEPITQQAAGQHLARAGWDGVREAVEYYEEVMRTWRPK